MHTTPTTRQHDFEGLYRRHLAAVTRYVARRSSSADVADVVAETLTTAWRRFEVIPEPPMDLAWLYRVARQVMANHYRGDHRRSALVERLQHSWDRDLASSDGPAQVPEALALQTALSELSALDQEVLLLSAWEELTPSEIAVVLDVKAEVVRNRLTRARRRFADALAVETVGEMEGTSHAGN